ncbi:Sin3 associated polypeptide p18-domain-containing protein [Lasiosphaeria miniovina]|uniref:Sin3 associated polypeptide p18-domain-containing protein n=1 Tax=Lasiosphaeria miniovina TaxID=1954250 RepID=A0AA40E006_9PEZI|nr:Sin3 associated polypeptide p18-domain-containing protein [Lasiosphaeria miniovina]KAK0722854.1 Sin3 associated polypeptide p18-domain-containing protein [Lasiosphaeria miniovina]
MTLASPLPSPSTLPSVSAYSDERESTPVPFSVKIFYRTGAFHRPDEFAPAYLPRYIEIPALESTTLLELGHHLAAEYLLPDPCIGTRLQFRLVYPDTRGSPEEPPRYLTEDLGSVVLGAGGPGVDDDSAFNSGVEIDDALDQLSSSRSDETKTLAGARFIVGDYISVAILPPSELTGEVAPANSARIGRGAGVGEAKGGIGALLSPSPPPSFNRGRVPSGSRSRGESSQGRGFGWGPDRDRHRRGGSSRGLPDGEWRRGDTLPSPSGRP